MAHLGMLCPFRAMAQKSCILACRLVLSTQVFDPSLLQFDGQYNPLIGYDPNIASGESFLTTDAFIFDSGAGIYYDDASPDDKVKLFGGAGIYHINGAPDPFARPPVPKRSCLFVLIYMAG